MKQAIWKYVLVFILGMLTLVIGYLLLSVFGGFRRPSPAGIVEDYGSICFWYDDQGSMQASVSPKGCYSTTCTRQVSQTGSGMLDQDSFQIHIDSRFALAETSRWPLPCTENCSGGGTVNFELGPLKVGQYQVWFGDELAGEFNVYSGLPTPRQCIENSSG
jgi:hypothetical protein